MKRFLIFIIFTYIALPLFGQKRVRVVTTLSTYADIAKQIGKDRVDVKYLVPGNQDAHFIRPKPSFAVLLSKADVFVTTGLDLELWVPTLVDMSKNPKIRSGQIGFVAAADGVRLLDKPTVLSRSEGGLHIYGNPHIITGPQNLDIIAKNITIGLKKNDPDNALYYESEYQHFSDSLYNFIYGKKLVRFLGKNVLSNLASQGTLIPFLKKKEFKGKRLIEYADGLLKKAEQLYGKKIVSYHKNWIYLSKILGIQVIGYVEPKPGIPPSPRHVKSLVDKMKEKNIHVLLAANYFDEKKVWDICDKVGAVPVIVPMGVDEKHNINSVFDLMQFWIDGLTRAFQKVEQN